MAKDASVKPYRIGALAYLYDPNADQLLLVQLTDYQPDQWGVPGGGREQNETAEDNIRREIQEEVGLVPSDYTLVARASRQYVYDFPPGMFGYDDEVVRQYRGQRKDQFLVHVRSNAVITANPSEVRAVMWCTPNHLQQYLRFPGQYENAVATLREFGVIDN